MSEPSKRAITIQAIFVRATIVSAIIIAVYGLAWNFSGHHAQLSAATPSLDECTSFFMDHIDQDPAVLASRAEDVAYATKCRAVVNDTSDEETKQAFSRWAGGEHGEGPERVNVTK